MRRIVFLDYLRVFAIFMVMLVHCCECYYFGGDGGFFVASASDANWLASVDSFCRSAVPLFVMASAYLLFPTTMPTGPFLRRRLTRVGIPFLFWAIAYTALCGGRFGELFFNFPSAGGHLWFVPMLCGLYLLMPLLSPWAERASERELKGWIAAWLFTALFPFLRGLWGLLYGEPPYGAVPYLYGECAWNGFGTFHYVSGFVGYMLIGFWFRKFAPEMSWRRTLARALPLLAVGWAVVWAFFRYRIPDSAGYPAKGPYALAVVLEMSWEYCSAGVAAITVGCFLVLRKLTAEGRFYRLVVRPLSEASFGVYLLHMFILTPLMGALKTAVPTPVGIFGGAIAVYLCASFCSLVIRRIPFLGRWLCG